ncbi:hypothetical protein ACWA5Z_11085 [Testudinibacter sp. P80/BLE/0925]|uniref:hypothetical protein n=1 Tax=Testudinibacter sp. TW-1 TaxID=3417757 RepID=UPI003D36DB26
MASGTTSAAAPHLNALGQELGEVGKAVLDIGAGMAIGAASGGGTAAVSAGGNTDWHNRQLHPREMDWIRDNAAAFAKEQGISVAEAERRLIERAAQRVDYAWSKMIDSQDTAADSFLSSASGIKGDVPPSSAVSFINSDGKPQNLFSASRDEYYSIGKYSDLAARYNRENNQLLTNTLVPKVKNNLVFEGVKDGGNALSEAARAALNSPTETLRGVTGNLAHSLSECLKHPTACATEKWATFDSASGDLLRTHYNQADVNALYGKEMTAETALVPLVRGGTVVAEVLPAAKAGSVAVKSVDNMLSPLAKGVSANDKLPVVGDSTGYLLNEVKVNSKNITLGNFKGSTANSLERFNNYLSDAIDTTAGSGVKNAKKPAGVSIETDWENLTKDAKITYSNDRRIAVFPSGERAIFRPSKTGPMTIELQRPDRKKIIEVCYENN